jgi:hypothetical protein
MIKYIASSLLALALGTSLTLAGGCPACGGGESSGIPADYPLKTCVISGEKLGEHGKPVKVSHDGTDVYLCCKDCTEDFQKDAAGAVAKVKKAAAEKK